MSGQVELKQTTGTGVGSGQPVKFQQWNVTLDRVRVGYLAFNPGSKICFITRLDPIIKQHVESEAAKLAGVDSLDSTQRPDTPPELLNPDKDEDDEYGDIDTGSA